MYYKILFIMIIALGISALGYAEEKIVKIATLKDYPPFCVTEKEYSANQIIPVGSDAVGFGGYSWDILRESFHEMGYTIHLSITPWPRAMSYVKSGKADVLFPTGKNLERHKIFYYSNEFVNHVNLIVYVQAKNKIKWTGLETLKGLTVGVKRGFNYGDRWNAATDVKKFDVTTILQGFKMLKAGRIDGFLGYEYNWDYVINQNSMQTKYRKLSTFDSLKEYVATLKTNPNGKEILKDFDAGKRRLITNGKLQNINREWSISD